jgi:hypothetical protein
MRTGQVYTPAQELAEARRAYALARARFEWATEPEMIDAAAYELEAARIRLNAAVRRAKLEWMAGRRSA